jgi:hypothetical protein
MSGAVELGGLRRWDPSPADYEGRPGEHLQSHYGISRCIRSQLAAAGRIAWDRGPKLWVRVLPGMVCRANRLANDTELLITPGGAASITFGAPVWADVMGSISEICGPWLRPSHDSGPGSSETRRSGEKSSLIPCDWPHSGRIHGMGARVGPKRVPRPMELAHRRSRAPSGSVDTVSPCRYDLRC